MEGNSQLPGDISQRYQGATVIFDRAARVRTPSSSSALLPLPPAAPALALLCSSTPSVCAAKCWLNNIRASNRNYLALRFSALRGE